MLLACIPLRYRRTPGRGARAPPRFESRGIERPRDVEALHLVAAELAQQLRGGAVLDAFGDHHEAEVVREVDGGEHDRAILGIRDESADERAVDLQLVDLQLLDV